MYGSDVTQERRVTCKYQLRRFLLVQVMEACVAGAKRKKKAFQSYFSMAVNVCDLPSHCVHPQPKGLLQLDSPVASQNHSEKGRI